MSSQHKTDECLNTLTVVLVKILKKVVRFFFDVCVIVRYKRTDGSEDDVGSRRRLDKRKKIYKVYLHKYLIHGKTLTEVIEL